MRWFMVDFETASQCDLARCGAARYAEDPSTEVLCFNWHEMTRDGQPLGRPGGWSPYLGPVPEGLRFLAQDPSAMFVAHNAAFEKMIWRHVMAPQFGFPDIPNERWDDTMASCAEKGLPLALDNAARVLKLSVAKDMAASKFTVGLSSPARMFDRGAETLKRVMDYCHQDNQVEMGVRRAVRWLTPGERKVWLLDQRINERGIYVDRKFVADCKVVVQQALEPAQARFKELTGLDRVTLRERFLSWLGEQGVWLPNLTKDTVSAVFGPENPEDDAGPVAQDFPPHVLEAVDVFRQINSSAIAKLEVMASCPSSDGRARHLCQYHGAGPGRWAGRLIQPHNFPRPAFMFDDALPDTEALVSSIASRDAEFVRDMWGVSPIKVVASSLRGGLVAAPGKVLLAGDYKSVEAILVLSMAGQHDKTALMASGADAYCDMATAIYGYPVNKRQHPEQRQIGKFTVLGCCFQMGWQKFQFRYGRNKTEDFCRKVITTYREDWAPQVPKMWYALEDAATRTVHTGLPHEAFGVTYEIDDLWLTARLPSGRRLWYYHPQKCVRAMPWDKADLRPGFTYEAQKAAGWTTVQAYGGLLTENAVQGTARDLLVHSMFRAEEEGLDIVLTVHDELVIEAEERRADPKVLKQIMEDIPDWARELQAPITADVWDRPARRLHK